MKLAHGGFSGAASVHETCVWIDWFIHGFPRSSHPLSTDSWVKGKLLELQHA
jgi:hypothetical protein